ncbi:hypothetical protein BD324DRAFT_634900 [Kockovaella imperatae]|uniref:Uncharacterized protein n=1 Tax=Kockovaella imperatae TaxID=4999 RepID=A0A1Y1U9Q8_9TREE|nr:hypothetical protein BD324DRAFT_634900 [Kockovaella imperatae]ORX34770.1 hypothetical protein BD324DRAFT_634900 [Kockovaella imperatae]
MKRELSEGQEMSEGSSTPPLRALDAGSSQPTPPKRFKAEASPSIEGNGIDYRSLACREFGPSYNEWPAPARAILAAQKFIIEITTQQLPVLIAPDKDADGLSAGTLLHKTLLHLGLPETCIQVQHLQKGNNVHSAKEVERIAASGVSRVIVLDQGSRPGPPIFDPDEDGQARTLIIDHHYSHEWPDHSVVLTACHSPPIVTTSLLTYLLLRDLAPSFVKSEGWRALVGLIGDLGPNAAEWGQPPWPTELGRLSKRLGSKALADSVAAINAPRRTAEYDVPKAWKILLEANTPQAVASHAYLKLCKLDVGDETQKWARTAPKFSQDGRIALITISTGFQIHPVIATRWAGTLGRKSGKLVMVMCANTAYNPDGRVSFSCRIAATLRTLPDGERPNLIQLLLDIGHAIPGFMDRVGGDFARGHKEATGIGKPPSRKNENVKSPKKPRGADRSIRSFFEPVPR